ncbi:hypothetical protein BDZ89DRAFT_1141610 [Hymenopellis radicata]|nr:hypothetical protein BDZ89DRAFT_1141610 [Hymenopellis radicata]
MAMKVLIEEAFAESGHFFGGTWAFLSFSSTIIAGTVLRAHTEELLRQNHPPLDIELSAFRKVAEDTRTALEDLDLKIVQAQELLENLLSARQQAQSHLEDAKSILHPMRSIPNEVLAEIFGHCVLKAYSAEDPDTLDPKGGPWLLARVCRRWRELAVNTSQLWTHLFLDVDKHLGHITERQCAYKAGLFIQRSRGLPLDVYLGSAKSVADHPVLPVLEVSIPQWRYLYVDLQPASLQSLSGNSFLNLQWLKLIHDESDLHVDVFRPMRAPVLRDFEAAFSESWRDFEHVSLPWSHLTSVAHFPAFAVEALNYLRTMADLEKLDVLAGSETHTPIHDVISVPKLRRLTITEATMLPAVAKSFSPHWRSPLCRNSPSHITPNRCSIFRRRPPAREPDSSWTSLAG